MNEMSEFRPTPAVAFGGAPHDMPVDLLSLATNEIFDPCFRVFIYLTVNRAYMLLARFPRISAYYVFFMFIIRFYEP